MQQQTTKPLFRRSPLEDVREGMTVVDAEGQPLGTVADVFPGYPDSVATNEDELDSGLVGLIIAPLESTGGTSSVGAGMPVVVGRLLDEPDMPDELRFDLLRGGFIEIRSADLRGLARYIPGDQIAEVTDGVVRLKRSYRRPSHAATHTAPRLVLGATVRTVDGENIGKVDRFIVDPYRLAIRALVVRKGLILPHAVEIPLVAIQSSDEREVRLRYTAEQVKRLPEFVDAQYAAPPPGFVPPVEYARDSMAWPQGVPLLPPPPPRRDETAVRWAMNNAEIRVGDDVLSRDGVKIGEIEGVLLDPATGRPGSFFVRRGVLFKREIEFPIETIRAVGDGVVYLSVSADEARAYEQQPAGTPLTPSPTRQ